MMYTFIIPFVEYLLQCGSLYSSSRVFWINDRVIWPILGYYLEYIVDISMLNKRKLSYIWALAIGSNYFSVWMLFIFHKRTGEYTELFHNGSALFNAIAIFLTIRYVCRRMNDSEKNKIIRNLGRDCFGVYLIHYALLRKNDYVVKLWNLLNKAFYHAPMLSAIIMVTLIYTTSVVIVKICKKNRIFGKLI